MKTAVKKSAKLKKLKAKKKTQQKPATHIVMVLDRSGSMESIREATVRGMNAFVAKQRDAAGKCIFTLIQFDGENAFDVVCEAEDIQTVPILDLLPRGNTPLYDCLGQALRNTAHWVLRNRATLVLFVIITDGLENASKEFTAAQVKETIRLRGLDGWEFVYLGANQDALVEGAKLGIRGANSATFTGINTQCAFEMSSTKVMNYRSTSDAVALAYTDPDRQTLTGGSHGKT